ncbi:endonuclease/exonuclease/phosphatase family protein, partial [Rhizobium ruizarguesonis]
MPIVEQLVLKHRPDILCLQETKVTNDLFPAAPLRAMADDLQKLLKANGEANKSSILVGDLNIAPLE